MSDELSEMMFEAVAAELEAEAPEIVTTDLDEGDDNPTYDLGTDSDNTDEVAEPEEDADTEDAPPVADDGEAFDWNEILEKFGDRPVPLKVNGQIVERPLREAFDGAMMREDYSRKTAELSDAARAAQWAQDVQESFARDPHGTLEAFAKAYGVQPNALTAPVPQTDPYEDFDPDVAAVMRKMDEQEARHQAELEAIRQQTQSFEQKQIVAEVQKEIAGLRQVYGESFDEEATLRAAVQFNMDLTEAAELLEDRRIAALSRQAEATGSAASAAAAKQAEAARQAKKKRAAGTTTKGYDASSETAESFNTISELFEIVSNTTS